MKTRHLQQMCSLLPGDILAERALQIGSGDDLTSLATRATVKFGNQFAHQQCVGAGGEQLMEMRNVVPER